MGTVAEKLSYLVDTKDLFKDRLNSLGAEITSSTTFRNYLTWLDTFYGEVSDKTDLSINGVVGRTSQNTAILPSEYTQVDYIESHGTEYIDTGYLAKGDLKVITDIEYTSTVSGNRFIYGGRDSVGLNNNALLLSNDGTTIRNDYNTTTNVATPNVSNIVAKWHIAKDKGSLIVTSSDNQTITQTTTNATFSSNYNIYIFTCNNASNVLNPASYRLYTFKMYDNDTLVRDFIPCFRNSDNEVGLYDIVNDVFYTNQRTGVFTYGAVISIPNPDYPQPINNLSGDVAYKVSGKNLIKYPYYRETLTNNGITWKSNSDGTITINGTATAQSVFYLLYNSWSFDSSHIFPQGTYTLNMENGNDNVFLAVNYYDENNANVFYKSYPNQSTTFNITDKRSINMLRVVVAVNTTVNNLVVKPQIEQGSTATTYEPYIEPQTFNIPLKSKNLANLDIIDRVPSISNGRMANLPGAASSDFIEVDNTKEYIFQYKFSGTNERYIFFYDEDKNFISSISGANVPSGVHINSFNSFSRSKYIKLRIDKKSNINWVQLEESSTPTDYEPYYDIELCKIDTYEDKIYSSNGRFYLYKNIDKKFENSFTTILTITSTLADNLYGYACNVRGISSYSELGAIISNIFVPKILGSQTDTTNPNNVRFNMGIAKHNYTSQVVITIDKKYLDTGTTTEFSNFLNNNNFEFYCVLATPTTTEITQENYPSLYNALKQIQDYLTAYKINKEFILGYSSPEIEY